MSAEVAVIIVNWNNWQDTNECITSLKTLTYSDLNIIVVDNSSTDDSMERISQQHPEATLIQAERNLGFAAGNNLGIRRALEAKPKYIWLLNNDTVVVPHALASLVAIAEGHPGYDFFGSWIVYYSQPDRLWFGGGAYNPLSGHTRHELYGARVADSPARGMTYETDWISGCSLLVRAASLHEIGLLDESFFLYCEDLEWQLRQNPRRPRAMLLGEPLILHKIGASTGSPRSYLSYFFSSRNFIKLSLRYAGPYFPLWMLTWLFRYLLRQSFRSDRVAMTAVLRSLFSVFTPSEEVVAAIAKR